MKRYLFPLVSLLVIVAMVLGACTPKPAATPTPKPVKVVLWHGWTDANEVALANAAIENYKKANAGAEVEVLAVPFDQLKNKFTTEASTGGGPDLLIGPKDWIGELANANLVVPLDDVAKDVLAGLNQAAIDANKFKGKVMALPETTEAVVLWYNKTMVPTPPKDTDELLKIAADKGLALNTGFYHSVGFLFGFGGQLFDSNQKCVFDQGDGVANYLDFMAKAKNSKGVLADSDGGKLDAAFKDGKVGMIFNGPWATGDYTKALGADKIAVAAPLKITASGKQFAPFLGTKNIFMSVNCKPETQKAAVKLMGAFVSADVLSYTLKAGHIPTAKTAKADDPIVNGIIAQTQVASYFPNEPEMGAVWGPAGDMITKVIEGKSKAADAVKEATGLINSANKK